MTSQESLALQPPPPTERGLSVALIVTPPPHLRVIRYPWPLGHWALSQKRCGRRGPGAPFVRGGFWKDLGASDASLIIKG